VYIEFFVFITYNYGFVLHNKSFSSLTGTCVQYGSDARVRILYLKFDSQKNQFFRFDNRMSKKKLILKSFVCCVMALK